jgi:conjugal transfer mating pair stabilization protein TraN
MLGRVLITLLIMISGMAFGSECIERDLECLEPVSVKPFGGLDIHRECWKYRYKLNCEKKSKNDCNQVPADSCLYTGEECLEKIKHGEEVCINYKQNFSCEKEVERDVDQEEIIKNGEKASAKDLMCKLMCLDSDCGSVKKASDEVNTELAEAAGMLNMLSEMKKDMIGDKLITIFKGTQESCDRSPWNFLNCCKLKGWGNDIFGAKCGVGAKNLAKKNQGKRCVRIGTYCEKILKIPFMKKKDCPCIKLRTNFCCYDSLIGKIINQEAKRQLGISNGSPKYPNCGGITIEDLSRVDLSKTDFSDFYKIIVKPNIKLPDIKLDVKTNEKSIKHITESVKSMPEGRRGFNTNLKEVQ